VSETCLHGWRGSHIQEPICDPCPKCGLRSLFIGKGGYLTCSSLQCEQPGVGREMENLSRRCAAAESRLARLVEALEFYADPTTYFAIGFFPDPPNGEFMDDFDETELGHKPGKLARTVLRELEESDGE